eukprot:scaffold320132_cov19-Tisochrysis_lutea.AAC.1
MALAIGCSGSGLCCCHRLLYEGVLTATKSHTPCSCAKNIAWHLQFGALGVGCAAAAVLLYEGVRIAETTLRPIPRIVSAPLGGALEHDPSFTFQVVLSRSVNSCQRKRHTVLLPQIEHVLDRALGQRCSGHVKLLPFAFVVQNRHAATVASVKLLPFAFVVRNRHAAAVASVEFLPSACVVQNGHAATVASVKAATIQQPQVMPSIWHDHPLLVLELLSGIDP